MSVEAISWALNLAPIPEDKPGKPNPACAAVLIGLANHAGPDGTAAFPSVHTLIRYTRLSERTVQAALKRLADSGVIKPCRPEIIAAHIARADQRPNGWDLGLALVRTDLDELDLKSLERLYPGIRNRIAAAQNGAQPLPPVASAPGNGVRQLRPVPPNGGQPTTQRGAAVAPEPSYEPEPKTTSSQASASRKARPPATRIAEDFRPDEVSVKQIERLRPDVDWRTETMRFRAYWEAKPGAGGEKTDWQLTWRNWMKRSRAVDNVRQMTATRNQAAAENWD